MNVLNRKFYLTEIEHLKNEGKKRTILADGNHKVIHTFYNQGTATGEGIIWNCLTRMATEFPCWLKEWREGDLVIDIYVSNKFSLVSVPNYWWITFPRDTITFQVRFCVDPAQSCQGQKEEPIGLTYSLIPQPEGWKDPADAFRNRNELLWKRKDREAPPSQKMVLLEHCTNCEKETHHAITYNSWVNYWEIISRREFKEGRNQDEISGEDLGGRYECLDCHAWQTDFYLDNDDGSGTCEVELRKVLVKRKYSRKGIFYLIVNQNKIKDRGNFYCFSNQMSSEDWAELEKNYWQIRGVRLEIKITRSLHFDLLVQKMTVVKRMTPNPNKGQEKFLSSPLAA